MTTRIVLALAAVGLTLGGCQTTTHLESVKTNDTVASRRGAPYSLQFTQYTVVLTRRVVDCGSRLKAVNKAAITAALVDDGDHTYVIPFHSLSSPFKVSDLKVEWSNGRLVSVNASAEDRTAQTLTAAAQGIGKIAVLASTGGVVNANDSIEGCTDEVVAQLQAEKLAKDDIAKEKTAVDRARSAVTRTTAAYVASGNDAAQRPALVQAVNELDAAALRLQDAEERLKTALTFLTHETTVTWPQDGKTFETDEPFTAPPAIFAKWWKVPQETGEADQAWEARKAQTYLKLAEPLKMWFALARVGTYGRDPSKVDAPPAAADGGTAEDGIRFRLPASGRLVVCEKSKCKRDPSDAVVQELAGPVAQLGHIYYADFSSPAFTNGSFELVLDDQGRPKKMGVARKNAAAETVAGLGRDLATEFSTVYAALNKTPAEKAAEELAALETEKKLVDARAALDPNSPAKQLAVLEMQKKLADARGALEQSPTYELARLTAIAEAQRKYNDAIEALRPGSNQDQVQQRLALEAETALLQAEAKQIEAKITLRDAKARLGL